MDDSPRWFKSSYSNFAFNCLEVAFTQPIWRKSGYSNMEDHCVGVAAVPESAWRKSSHSSMEGAECVEAAFAGPCAVMVRDTQNRETTVLGLGTREWAGFVTVLADRRS